MKKFIKIENAGFLMLMLAGIGTAVLSCKKGQNNAVQDNYLGQEVNGTSKLDSALYNLFTKPYNIDVRYKWDQSQFDQQYVVVPPHAGKVLPYVELVKKLWIDPYNVETGSESFIKAYAPKQLILAGSPMINKNGTAVQGLAEGGLDIMLANVNGTKLKDSLQIQDILHLVNHEFTHILNQKKVYSPDYNQVTPSDYSGSWNVDKVDPLKLGFISAYARKEPGEDIAEMVSWMLTWGKDYYENVYLKPMTPDPTLYKADSFQTTGLKDKKGGDTYILKSDLVKAQLLFKVKDMVGLEKLYLKLVLPVEYNDGIAKVRKKEAIIVAYFKSAFNIDFYSLQANVQKAYRNALK